MLSACITCDLYAWNLVRSAEKSSLFLLASHPTIIKTTQEAIASTLTHFKICVDSGDRAEDIEHFVRNDGGSLGVSVRSCARDIGDLGHLEM